MYHTLDPERLNSLATRSIIHSVGLLGILQLRASGYEACYKSQCTSVLPLSHNVSESMIP